jgi:hypothetical protein
VNGLRFRLVVFSIASSVNSQTKTSKVRYDKLGGGDQFSAAEKYEGRIVDVIGLEERELGALVGVDISTCIYVEFYFAYRLG